MGALDPLSPFSGHCLMATCGVVMQSCLLGSIVLSSRMCLSPCPIEACIPAGQAGHCQLLFGSEGW